MRSLPKNVDFSPNGYASERFISLETGVLFPDAEQRPAEERLYRDLPDDQRIPQ